MKSNLFSVMHVLRPNNVVAYTPFRGPSLFANGPLNSLIGSSLALRIHHPCDHIKLIDLESVPERADLRGSVILL